MRIAVLTGGGDVPGLNPAIKAIVNRALDNGYDVLGIRRGWRGLVQINPDDDSTRSWVFPLTKETVRRVDRFDLFNEAPGIYRLEAEGNGFLKQMVRAMVGTVLDVGMGKKPITDIPESIRGRNRALVGQTAPAEGLCLVEVCYGAKFAL